MASLTDQFLGSSNSELPKENTNEKSLTDNVLSGKQTIETSKPEEHEQFNIETLRQKNRTSFVRGMRDILDSAAHGLGHTTSYVADKLLPEDYSNSIKHSVNTMLENDKTQRDIYDKGNPPSEGILPNGSETNRLIGQTVATLPLMPAKAFQTVKGAMGALPTVNTLGQKVAAPFLNRAAASAATGAVGGAGFGGLTSSTTDESTVSAVGKGLITGVIAGPLLTSAEAAGRNVLPTIKNMWANVQIGKLVQATGMEPSAVKKVITYLETAGISPKQAQLELNKLGPDATLGDLASSLQARVGGLATFDPKAMEVVKGRYEARAKTANSEAQQLMENKLGPKPNIEAEKEAILNKARADTKGDYKTAYNSGDVLDPHPIISIIDENLKNAVGAKKSALLMLKDFMHTDSKDNLGNPIKTAKYTIPELHEIRQAIDDVVEKKQGAEGYGANALRAINDVRSAVDAQLKTNPAMANADAKFSEKMTLKDAMSTGYDVLSGTKNGMNKEEFAKMFDSSSPEIQDAIKKGLRAKIGDLMERASRGELSEAQRLFGKSSLNRANIEKAFGNKGVEVLDELQKQAMFRNTEKSVLQRSLTAEGQAVQREFGERNDAHGSLSLLHGAALDLATGGAGGATSLSLLGRFGNKLKTSIGANYQDRLVQGTADVLSRQGAERNIALDVANKVTKIQNRISKKASLPIQIPTGLLSGPVGQLSYFGYRNANKE